MPLTINNNPTSVTNLSGSNSTSSISSINASNNNIASILNNNTAKSKNNLLANHHLNNKNTTLTEQPDGNGSQNFCLKWNQHTTNLIKNLTEMVVDQQIVDVTIAVDGSSIKAHKIVLSACSNYFKELFMANPCKHPIVILKDIKINEIRAIMDWMYRGEVNVAQNQLSSLLKTAEILRVKGLAEVTGECRSTNDKLQPNSNETGALNKLNGLDNAVAAVAALNGKLMSNGQLNYDSLQSNDSVDNSTDPLYNNNLLNLANLSSLRMNNLNDHLNNLNSLNNSTNNLCDSAQSEMLKRKKKRKRIGNNYIYTNNKNSLVNANSTEDGDQAISLVTSNKDTSENNENSSNSCNSSYNSTDNSTINNSLRNLCYIKKESQIVDQGNESDCGNCSGDESNDTLKRTKDLLNVIAAAGGFNQTGTASVANFYRSSTPDPSNQSLLAFRRKLMQQQFNTLSPKTAQYVPDNSDNSNWLQSRQMVEASLIEPYEDNEEEMIDVRPIVSFDEGSANVPTNNYNSDQMVVMNSLDINSMTSNIQSGKICVCPLCHQTFTAQSSLRRHMQRHIENRERYQCDICKKTYSRKDYLKEHRKLKHVSPLVPNIVAN